MHWHLIGRDDGSNIYYLIWASSRENLSSGGGGGGVRSLISAFVIRLLKSILSRLATCTSEILTF